ncbi:MAG: beta-propeller domain-containing protein [Burkholderiaceae bacterium]
MSLAAVLAGTVAFAGCGGSGDSGSPPGTTPQPSGSAQLKFFAGDDGCARLESYIETTAEAMLREQLEGMRWTSGDSNVAASPQAPTMAPAPAPTAGAAAAESFSTTTVRSPGVDEPDPVKNDGQRLFTLKRAADAVVLSRVDLGPDGAMAPGGQIRWPSPALGSGLETSESPDGLYLLAGSRIVALTTSGSVFGPYPMPLLAAARGPAPAMAAAGTPSAAAASPPPRMAAATEGSTSAMTKTVICGYGYCYPRDTPPPSVRMRVVDAADATLPTRWEIKLDGALLGSRRIGDRIHLVTQSNLKLPDGVQGYPTIDNGRPTAQAEWNRAIDRQIEANARLIPATDLATWLAPLATGSATAISSPPSAADCASFARIDAPSRLGWLHVTTVDVATQTVSRQTALADASALYMSAGSLLLSTPQWNRSEGVGETYLHRFVAGADGHFAYQGSGRIEGTVINDYAIDESSQGVIRMATSSQTANGQPYTYLVNLGPGTEPQTLRELGRTPPIAPGERLQSARFLGDRAYLVTFRQVDPFFVYDLSDAANPKALGELKIPGFSTFLYPVGTGHVLGIGYQDGGWPRRIKATLFDVTDPANPLEQSTLALGDSYTASDALWDPHAFTWYSPASAIGDLPAGGNQGTLAIPVRSYASSAFGTAAASGIRVVSVRPGQGAAALSLNGTLSMDDLVNPARYSYDGWRGGDARRAVFVGSTVYGVADGAVRSAPITTPAAVIATVTVE